MRLKLKEVDACIDRGAIHPSAL